MALLPMQASGCRPRRRAWTPPKQGRPSSKQFSNSLKRRRALCLKGREEDEYPLCYDLPEPKDQLLKMLVEGDAQQFVDCMVGHLRLLAQFTPAIDKLLGVATAGQR